MLGIIWSVHRCLSLWTDDDDNQVSELPKPTAEEDKDLFLKRFRLKTLSISTVVQWMNCCWRIQVQDIVRSIMLCGWP